MFWQQRSIFVNNVSITSHCPFFIYIYIVYFQNELLWLYPVVYDSPSATVTELWWKYLREIASSCQFPRLVMGDFSDVLSFVDKLGGRFCFRKAEIFAESIDACDLLDTGFLGLLSLGIRNTETAWCGFYILKNLTITMLANLSLESTVNPF